MRARKPASLCDAHGVTHAIFIKPKDPRMAMVTNCLAIMFAEPKRAAVTCMECLCRAV